MSRSEKCKHLRRHTSGRNNLIAVWPCHDEDVANHGASERPPNPCCRLWRHDLTNELLAGGTLREDDTIRNSVRRVGDTIEDEAVARVDVRGSYLREHLLRIVSAMPFQDRWIVVPEPTKGSREKSRLLIFMMGGRGRALADRPCFSSPYNVSSRPRLCVKLRGRPEHSGRARYVGRVWREPRELFVAITARTCVDARVSER